MSYLVDHEDEVMETMEQEHASREMFTLFEVGDTHYIVSMNDFYDEPVRGDDRVLNTKHREMMRDSLERLGEGDILCNFMIE